jgi:hypothetical protein
MLRKLFSQFPDAVTIDHAVKNLSCRVYGRDAHECGLDPCAAARHGCTNAIDDTALAAYAKDDVTRLSPLVYEHINLLGRMPFRDLLAEPQNFQSTTSSSNNRNGIGH